MALDPRLFSWPVPPAGENEPVAMRAVAELLDPLAGELRIVKPGETFLVPAGPRPSEFVLCGMAEVLERPSWWPSTTPTSPPRAIGVRPIEPSALPRPAA